MIVVGFVVVFVLGDVFIFGSYVFYVFVVLLGGMVFFVMGGLGGGDVKFYVGVVSWFVLK